MKRAPSALLAMALALTLSVRDQPRAEAARPVRVAAISARLTEIQRAMQAVTLVKRREYARVVAVKTELAAARRRLNSHLAGMDRGVRGLAPPTRAAVLRWRTMILHAHLAASATLRADRVALEESLRARRDVMKGFLSEIHDLVHEALREVGRDAGGWDRVWPIDVRPTGVLRACPVAGPWSLTDTFGAPRPGGRTHQGNDLLAGWETPLVAVHDGIAVRVPNELGGRAVIVRGSAGDTYYAHLSGYGRDGQVRAGEVIGFVGNSGNAQGRIHHLHFEWRPGGGVAVNPYRMLLRVC